MAIQTYNLGTVTAYGDAKAGGYTGTLAEWQALMANYAVVGQQAAQNAQIATTKASEANASADLAEIAKTAAETAQQQAETAAASITVDNTLSIQGKAADAKATGDEISELKSGFDKLYNTAYVTDSASGSIAHITDGADSIPMKSLKVNIVPAQSGSGDPSPSNVRPISGWTGIKVMRAGKNLIPKYSINPPLYNGVTFTVNSDGSVNANGTASATCNASSADIIGIGGEVTLSGCPSGGSSTTYQLWIFDRTANATTAIVDTGNGSTGTLIKDHVYTVRIRIQGGYTVDKTFYPMLRISADSAEYEPYNGKDYNISLSNAGTVYGGTLDVVSGELTVDRVAAAMESLTWYRSTSYANPIFYATVSGKASDYRKSSCSILRNIGSSTIIAAQGFATRASDGDYACSNGNAQIYVRLNSATTVQDFVTAVTGQTIVYPLATPITYNLTPAEVKSLLGINNIWSDAGDVDVEYRADTKLYIDKRLGV